MATRRSRPLPSRVRPGVVPGRSTGPRPKGHLNTGLAYGRRRATPGIVIVIRIIVVTIRIVIVIVIVIGIAVGIRCNKNKV